MLGIVGVDRMIDQRLDQVRPLEEGQALERAEADVAVRKPHQHRGARRRGLVAARQRLAGLEQRERLRGVDAERLQHLRRQHLAHAALQRQPAVAEARIGRLARALGAEIEQPACIVAQLGEQEAAAIADVADCRCGTDGRDSASPAALGMLSGSGSKRAKCASHSAWRERAEADALGPGLIAAAQHVLWKSRRPPRDRRSPGPSRREHGVGPVACATGMASI